MYAPVLLLIVSLNMCTCRDFYVGMFKQNDLLVAQDVLYKERVYYRKVIAKYGRIFKCPITYFRVVDRLGAGGGPKVEIIRGGLRSKYLVLRLTSPYNYPISVNIYVGCQNKMPTRSISHTKPSTKSSSASISATKTSQSGNSADVTTTDSSKINNTNVANSTAKAAYK